MIKQKSFSKYGLSFEYGTDGYSLYLTPSLRYNKSTYTSYRNETKSLEDGWMAYRKLAETEKEVRSTYVEFCFLRLFFRVSKTNVVKK